MPKAICTNVGEWKMSETYQEVINRLVEEAKIELEYIKNKHLTAIEFWHRRKPLEFRTDGSDMWDNVTIAPSNPSGWRCDLFGLDGQIVVRPNEDQPIPNWFWRKMQYLILGNKWVKDE